jgi:hypothetical protein
MRECPSVLREGNREVLALEIRRQLLGTKRRAKTPRLLTPDRGPSPAALRPAPVPKKYHDLAGDHAEQPGEGPGTAEGGRASRGSTRLGNSRRETPVRPRAGFSARSMARPSVRLNANPNRPDSPERRTLQAAQIGNRRHRLRFGLTRPQPPKPRGIARFSASVGAEWRAISARATSVAVDGVQGVLVSGVRSLLSRESTGNLSDFRHP